MCGIKTCTAWSITALLVNSLLSHTAGLTLVGARVNATHGISQVQIGKRLRDLVLAGVSISHLDNSHSVAQSVQRLLYAGYRYFELVVRRDAEFFSSHSSCVAAANMTSLRNDEITPTLVSFHQFAEQFPSEIIVIRLQLIQLSASVAVQLMATTFASIGSRLVPASVAFQSSVSEILRTERNIVVIVPDLSSLLSSATARELSELRPVTDYFVVDDIARNETDVSALNVVDRGGTLLEQHHSVQTLSVLVLNWQQVDDASSTSHQLLDGCHPLRSAMSLLTVVLVAVGWYKLGAGTRLSCVSRWSVVKLYGGLAAASTLMTLLLVLRLTSDHTSLAVRSTDNALRVVNKSCSAVVNAARHWITKPSRYRLNVFIVDHRNYCSCGCACPSTSTSGPGGLSALAKAGRIRRQVSLTHAGSPTSSAVGLRALFACPSVLFAYVVTSRDEGHVVAWDQLSGGDVISFVEGEFPMDATVAIYVATVWNRWLQVYATNVQHLVESGRDLYVRGSESRSGVGLAYITHDRRLLAFGCRGPLPVSASRLLNVTRWDNTSHRQPTSSTAPTNGVHVTGSRARHVTAVQSLYCACLVVVINVVVASYCNFDALPTSR